MGGGGSAQLTQSGFNVEYDRSGRAMCKQCKVMISGMDLMMGKLVSRTSYFLPLFLNLKRCRTTSRVIKSVDDMLGFTQISHQDQELVTILIGENRSKHELPQTGNINCFNERPPNCVVY